MPDLRIPKKVRKVLEEREIGSVWDKTLADTIAAGISGVVSCCNASIAPVQTVAAPRRPVCKVVEITTSYMHVDAQSCTAGARHGIGRHV